MPDNQSKSSQSTGKTVKEEVWAAISAFEQILEAMPGDQASLEALAHAYEQVGDSTRAKEYLARLGGVLIDEGDLTGARAMVKKIATLSGDSPAAADFMARLEAVEADSAQAALKASAEQTKGGRQTFSMAENLSFAWNLMEAQELTQEEYASVVQDLSEMSASEGTATVSVLHVLEARGFKNLERVVSFASRECNTPFILLSCFDFQLEAISLLPRQMMIQRGVIVFELLGADALVAVVNPYDQEVRKDVERLTSRRCRFFLTLPSELDRALDKANEILGA